MSTVVSLVGDLGLVEASEVRGRLLAALAAGDGLSIDVSGLVSADLAIVQLLAAAHKSATRRGVPIRLLAGADGALRAALVRLGFVGADGGALAAEGAFWLGDVA